MLLLSLARVTSGLPDNHSLLRGRIRERLRWVIGTGFSNHLHVNIGEMDVHSKVESMALLFTTYLRFHPPVGV